MLGQGYLTVHARKRITLDGGRSVMATRTPFYEQSTPTPDGGSIGFSPKSASKFLQTPSLSPKSPREISQERPRINNFPGRVNSPSSVGSGRPRSPSPSGVPDARKRSTPGTTPVISSNPATLIQVATNIEVQREQFIAPGPSNSSGSVPNIGQESVASKQAPSTPNPVIQFRHLISILTRKDQHRISFSELGGELRKNNTRYAKLGEYLKEAEQANIVKIDRSGEIPWVELVYPRKYVPLVNAMLR